MESASNLAKHFGEVLHNGTWIANTNFKQELTSVRWNASTFKINSLNTIATLAQHIHYYLNGVKNVLKGGRLDILDKFTG